MKKEGGGVQQLKGIRCIERGMAHRVQKMEEQKGQVMCAG
jgi:hypothetical protein